MLRNYFKLALKVLSRNKFFTGISLFGISFTLLILMVITAFYDAEFGENRPLSLHDKMVFLSDLKMEYVEPDTSWVIDSVLMDGQMAYDSTFTVGEHSSSTSTSQFSYYFLDRFMRDVDRASTYSFFSPGESFNVFIENRKLEVEAIYTDATYWDVFDFRFLEGEAYSQGHVRDAASVCVVTEDFALKYFGTSSAILGKEVELGNRKHSIVAIVDRARTTNRMVAADVYLPITTMDASRFESKEFLGGCGAAFLADHKRDKDLIKEELVARTAALELPDPERFNRISTLPMSFGEYYASNIIDRDDPAGGLSIIRLVFGILLSFFVLLPTLNLINMNLSRIMEREAEIGVRKAFGAHSGTILYQFVFENVIITFIGGIIGMLLAALVLYLINESEVLAGVLLSFNMRVFIYSIGICLIFGIVSGLLPAWKVSRLQIADVLKSNQL